MKAYILCLILYLESHFIKCASITYKQSEEEIDEDEEIVYRSPKGDDDSLKRNHPAEEVKNRIDNLKSKVELGYDFSKAIKILYSNYTNIDLKVSDLDLLYKKGIINENQAILIWESLLNTKTERNLEWLGYNKLTKNSKDQSNTGNKLIQNFFHLFYSPELKIQSIFTYFGSVFFYYLIKFLLKYPKINIVIIFVLMFANIINAFYFYNIKYYFTSFINLCSFIINVYYSYLSLVVLAGNKDIDYSILNTKHFKSREHFLVKTGTCAIIILLLVYLSSVSLRYFLNYLLIFYFLEKKRDMINNYFKLNSPKGLQPFENFISLIFGSIILIYTHLFYYFNISYSYDLNSFLIINNFLTLYYLSSLEKFIYIQRNRLGGIYLDCEKISDRRDKYELFEELKKKSDIDKNFRNENFNEGNIIDVILIFLCVICLFTGFYFNAYFYLLVSVFILHTIHKYCLIFLSIKRSRIVSNFLLLFFLLAISNLDQLNFSYINEIIAVYDPKFLEALLLLFKLLFLVSLAICNYLSEDFVDLCNIYNYSSYVYLMKETNSNNYNNEMTRKLNEIYTVHNVLIEIFEFDLATSLDCVNLVLDSINTSGSKIDGFYIDYLMTNNTSNYHIIPLIVDYFLMYSNVWILFDTFRNNNHSFFYITFVLHKLGLFTKLFLLTFEYSKTRLQKNLIVVLNMIFSMRFLSYNEFEDSEKIILVLFFLANVFIYIIVYDNSIPMNIFITFFNWVMLNNYTNAYPYITVSIGALFAKNLIHYLKIKHFKIFIYFISAINAFFIFSSIEKHFISAVYLQFKSLLNSNTLKIDIIGTFEDLCFPGLIHPGNRIINYSTNGTFFENFLIQKIKEFLQYIKIG